MARNRYYENTIVAMETVPGVLATATTTYKNVSDCYRFIYEVFAGANTNTTVTVQVMQALDAVGTGAKAVVNSSSTVLASTPNKWVGIDTMVDHLDFSNNFYFTALSITVAGGATTGVVISKMLRPHDTPVALGTDNAAVVYNDL